MAVKLSSETEIKKMDNKKQLWLATEPFTLLYTFTYGVQITILVQVIVWKLCLKEFSTQTCTMLNHTNHHIIGQNKIYKEASVWNAFITACSLIPSLIFILPFGSLSDLVSKRKLLFVPPTARLLQIMIFITCIVYESSHIAFLAIGACLTGIYGDLQGALTLAASYMADATSPGSERLSRMILLGGIAYIGTGGGAFCSGVVSQKFGFASALLVSMGACLVNIIYIFIFIPDLKKENIASVNGECQEFRSIQAQVSDVLKTTIAVFQNIYNFMRRYCLKAEGRTIWLLLFSYFFSIASSQGETSIIVLVTKHSPLNLSSYMVGVYVMLLMLIRGVGGFLLFVLFKRLDSHDILVISLGFLSFIATHVAIALSKTQTELLYFTTLSIGYSMTQPGIRAYLTKKVELNEHGTVLSCACFLSLFGVIATIFSVNIIFRITVDTFPGFVMLLLAACSSLGLALALIAAIVDYSKYDTDKEESDTRDTRDTDDNLNENVISEQKPLLVKQPYE